MTETGLQEFYRNRRVFVTGHTGFKGAWLCLWLTRMGCQVTGYALQPSDTNLYSLLNLSQKMDSVIDDVRDMAALGSAMQKANPEIVIHLAAQSLVLPSYEAPVDTYATNIMGTVNLLECVRNLGSVKATVNVTTDKCYENNNAGLPFSEGEPLGGYDPYSSSKAAAEIVTTAYRRSFLTAKGQYLASARAGNVIGGGDFAAHRLIPDIVRAIEAGKAVTIRNPASTRPWQHVLDVLYGYLLLGKAVYTQGESFAEAFNFGPDEDNITVANLAARFCDATGAIADIQPQHTMGHEAAALRLNNTKAKTKLGWHPLMHADEAIEWSAQWYQRYLQKDEIQDFTLSQLADYQSRLEKTRQASA